MELSVDVQYFILLAALLLVPKMLLRFGIPTALTAMAFGALTAHFLVWFQGDQTLYLLSTLGITSLFLFAGLEVDVDELKRDANVLLKNLYTSLTVIFLSAWGLNVALGLPFRAALVLSLGLTTPSTGFILNSLKGFHFTPNQEYWIRSAAIAKEIVALGLLFFTLQSESVSEFSISLAVILAMIFLLPVVFRFFLKRIAPFAPDSEVAFLILIALLCGVITRNLGTYYLVGAFLVGVTAARFTHFISQKKTKKLLYAVGMFFSFFVPFYFFKAGLSITQSMFTLEGVFYGLAFLLIFLPVRYLSVVASIKLFLPNSWEDRNEISVSLLPTLIFGLVIASILREQFSIPSSVISGLVLYTVVASVIPSLVMRKAPPEEYDSTLRWESGLTEPLAPEEM